MGTWSVDCTNLVYLLYTGHRWKNEPNSVLQTSALNGLTSFYNKSHYVMKMMINKLFYSEQYTTQRTLQCHQNETIAVAFGIELKITLTF